LRRDPYDQDFDRQLETPMSWWLTIKDKYNYLNELAIMIFSITPHSAGCERIFSTLGWLYGKRRQRLALSKIEAMAKIRSFNISNIKNELAYMSQKYSEAEMCEMINDSIFLQFEDEEENTNLENKSILEIPNHEVQVLIINEWFDLNAVARDPNNEDSESNSSEEDSENSDDEISKNSEDSSDDDGEMEFDHDGYDIDELTQKYLLDNESTEDIL
jgi:hypothetical protein